MTAPLCCVSLAHCAVVGCLQHGQKSIGPPHRTEKKSGGDMMSRGAASSVVSSSTEEGNGEVMRHRSEMTK